MKVMKIMNQSNHDKKLVPGTCMRTMAILDLVEKLMVDLATQGLELFVGLVDQVALECSGGFGDSQPGVVPVQVAVVTLADKFSSNSFFLKSELFCHDQTFIVNGEALLIHMYILGSII